MKKLAILFFVIILSGIQVSASKPIVDNKNAKGYVGTLPELGRKVEEGPSNATTKPQYEAKKDFNSINEIKPVPRDNPAFVNIILKSDKNSQFINDINELLPMLEKIYDMLERNTDIQKFIATTYFFNKNIEVLREKYEGKPEFNFATFQKILETDMHIQTVANLRVEAIKNTPYMPYGTDGKIYNSVNIEQQMEYLMNDIEEAIVAIKGIY